MEGKQEKPKKKTIFRDFELTFSQYRFSAPEYFAVMAALPQAAAAVKNKIDKG